MRRTDAQRSPMQQAVAELLRVEPFSGGATAEQIKAVAEKYELQPGGLEGVYLEAVDRLADQ